MKKRPTTVAETSDSVSCALVEILTPRYIIRKAAATKTMPQTHPGSGDLTFRKPGLAGSSVKNESWMNPPIKTAIAEARTVVPP